MSGRSMLDQDFEDDDLLPNFGDDHLDDDKPATKGKDDDADAGAKIEVDIIDDTPEADRGRPSADKMAADDDVTDDEAAEYSKRVRARIAKETAKVHAERRAKEDRERQLSEAVAVAQRLIQENNALKGLIENGEKVLMTESQGRLDGQINAAKSALREAREAGDVNGEIAAQETLAKLVAEKDRLSTHRAQPLQRMDEKELSRFAPQQRVVQPEPAALQWQDKNKWFGRDEAMTAFALGVHQQLVNREGIQPSDGDEYYRRIDGEMRKRFPERFQSDTTPRRTTTNVAGVSRSNTAGKATRKVTLTESQARLARRLGLTLEQYAEQLAAENGKKEWTYG